jgi:hypothetical protein
MRYADSGCKYCYNNRKAVSYVLLHRMGTNPQTSDFTLFLKNRNAAFHSNKSKTFFRILSGVQVSDFMKRDVWFKTQKLEITKNDSYF